MAAVSVFGGTPPPKPLICKSVSNRLGARFRSAWAHHLGGTPRHSCAIFSFGTTDIIATSYFIGTHSRFTFRCCHSPSVSGKQKTLLPIGKQGWGENFFSLRQFLLARFPIRGQPIAGVTNQTALAEFTAKDGAIMTNRAQRDSLHRPARGCHGSASFHRTCAVCIIRSQGCLLILSGVAAS
jgi:hypothetical protein